MIIPHNIAIYLYRPRWSISLENSIDAFNIIAENYNRFTKPSSTDYRIRQFAHSNRADLSGREVLFQHSSILYIYLTPMLIGELPYLLLLW